MKTALVLPSMLLCAVGLAAGQAPPVNPNIGHSHHHHPHQEKLATEPAGPDRALHFDGRKDYVRISNTARYQGPESAVPGRPQSDPATCLLLQLDEVIGLRSPDASPAQAHADRSGNPSPVPNH